ncbi:retinoic acid receptor responder protein 2 [Erinaceus europaeus]|uniref:Retinoic acid receptor responder protein 2 n=1 Tax=Erinaceus europaeus TaxID=9365 RepID=A0A1S3WSU4_ERIEU|nr:retinoic acid receptor responder protein 2 [Erinaceus europaeus]
MWWLVPLALWLAWTGRGSSVDLSEAQSRGLQVALDEFHKHPPVQWAFQVTSMDIASDVPFPSGTFVRLEFKLQQTSCRKKDWKTVECGLKRNGRKRYCLACIKLDFEGKVLGRMVHCPIQTQAPWEPERHMEARCSKVEQAGEDPSGLPGRFAFSRGLAGS